jgi:hypothetical protein
MTMAEHHLSCPVSQFRYRRTLKAYLNRSRVQKHSQHLLVRDPHFQFPARREFVDGHSHSLSIPWWKLDALIVAKEAARFGTIARIQTQPDMQDLFN